MSVETVARRYATALADVVIPKGEAAEVQKELTAWEEMMAGAELLLEVFRNPTIPYEKKRTVLEKLLDKTKVRPTTANFLQVLLRNQRLAELAHVNARFAQILDQRAGMISGEVTTARPVADDTRAALAAKLGKMTGKKVKLEYGTDAELIGGLVTRIGSTVYDGSVKNQLANVRDKMIGTRT
jgi:F-type H+-transporting ATPase subunit delta